MPRLPGRKSTRRTFEVEDLVVVSFIMDHEVWYWRRPCVVEGCDHRMGPDSTQPGWTDWEPCSKEALAAWVALDREGYESVGLACACHVKEILDRA